MSTCATVVVACAAALAGWTLGRRVGYNDGWNAGREDMRTRISRWLSGPV